MSKEYLGEFEELVLTMVGILQDDAYGNAIVNEIKDRLGRESNLSAVHVTLYRLEDKGLIKSKMGGATSSRGGRRKRIFTITNAGLAMLRTMKEARMDLWKLIPQLKMVSLQIKAFVYLAYGLLAVGHNQQVILRFYLRSAVGRNVFSVAVNKHDQCRLRKI